MIPWYYGISQSPTGQLAAVNKSNLRALVTEIAAKLESCIQFGEHSLLTSAKGYNILIEQSFV